jgi:putative spermidine/putrescine transport system ATP-binding protein
LYLRPRTAFVARFVGSANVADATLAQKLGAGAAFAIRAENVEVQEEPAATPAGHDAAPGSVLAVQFHGAASRWQVQLDAGEVWSALVSEEETRRRHGLAVGARVKLTWPREAAVVLDASSG